MTVLTTPTTASVTAIGTQGSALLSAHEAIVKGVLEAEAAVTLMAGPRSGTFAAVFRLAATPPMAHALRENGTRIIAAPDATRAITLAAQAAQIGSTVEGIRGALALVPNDRLDGATHIPLSQLPQRMAELDKKTPWLVMCAGGYRSVIGASVLQRAGFPKVASAVGGIDAARKAGVALVGERTLNTWRCSPKETLAVSFLMSTRVRFKPSETNAGNVTSSDGDVPSTSTATRNSSGVS